MKLPRIRIEVNDLSHKNKARKFFNRLNKKMNFQLRKLKHK